MTSKKHYALKLINPRPSFPMDMSPEERQIMMQHIAYWTDLMNKGFVIVFGPVLNPAGAYGLGVVEVDSEEQVQEFIRNDPASQISGYEYYPMQAKLPGRS